MNTETTKKEKATDVYTLLGNSGVCKITNDKFSWVLEVDGKTINNNVRNWRLRKVSR